MTTGLLIAALILAVVVAAWAAIERAWQLLLLALAVLLVIATSLYF
ncbi:hypothetical protein AB0C10_37505 [Microbispora amethystogenes]